MVDDRYREAFPKFRVGGKRSLVEDENRLGVRMRFESLLELGRLQQESRGHVEFGFPPLLDQHPFEDEAAGDPVRIIVTEDHGFAGRLPY